MDVAFLEHCVEMFECACSNLDSLTLSLSLSIFFFFFFDLLWLYYGIPIPRMPCVYVPMWLRMLT